MILEAEGEFKLSEDVKNANHWWDNECKNAIQEKNEARGKWLTKKKEHTWIYTIKRD